MASKAKGKGSKPAVAAAPSSAVSSASKEVPAVGAAAVPKVVACPVPDATVLKAVTALSAHLNKDKKKADLLEAGTSVFVNIRQFRIPGREKGKPVRIAVPHSVLNPEDGVSLCIIVKDPAKAFKEQLAAAPVPGFVKVIGAGKLRKNFSQYKDRIALANAYDGFFADDRVVRMMPQLLGKIFRERRKMPVPVKLSGGDWAAQLAKARDSTYMSIGPQIASIRIGHSGMPAAHLAANAMAVLRAAVPRLPKRWANVQRVDIAATNSVALPVYKALPSQRVVADSDALLEDSDEDEEETEALLKGSAGSDGSDEDDSHDDEDEGEDEDEDEEDAPAVSSAAAAKVAKSDLRADEDVLMLHALLGADGSKMAADSDDEDVSAGAGAAAVGGAGGKGKAGKAKAKATASAPATAAAASLTKGKPAAAAAAKAPAAKRARAADSSAADSSGAASASSKVKAVAAAADAEEDAEVEVEVTRKRKGELAARLGAGGKAAPTAAAAASKPDAVVPVAAAKKGKSAPAAAVSETSVPAKKKAAAARK